MGEVSQDVKFLTSEEILQFNYEFLLKSGKKQEKSNLLLNPQSLYYLVETVCCQEYIKNRLEFLIKVASTYAYNIISRHVFVDANKRTGLAAAFYFLENNDCFLKKNIKDQEIVDLGLNIANGSFKEQDVIKWFRKRTRLIL